MIGEKDFWKSAADVCKQLLDMIQLFWKRLLEKKKRKSAHNNPESYCV